MYRIIVVSHGSFAEALINSAQMIAGEQRNISYVSLKAEYCLASFRKEIESKINEREANEDVLILSDIMYGTPFNKVCKLMEKYDFEHFTGVNLPILLDCLMSRKNEALSETVSRLVSEGRETFIHVNQLIREDGSR